ncbi:MAG: HD domain-containing protein [Dehalococcoidia bacterium]
MPKKVITDPVHGDIYLNEIERMFLDSPPMQRLRRVRQLGTTHLVYPGATHSRFLHAVGALRAAQDLLDAVVSQGDGLHPVRDLFQQWKADPADYALKLAEATVLARLGALLHDLGHVAFGHSIEDDLKILDAHDKNVARFDYFWAQIENHDELGELIAPELKAALRPLILSKEIEDRENLPEPARRYRFVEDIVGNTICADLLDYLPRDHHFTGLPAKLGHRFIDGFYVTPKDHPYLPMRMAIQIARDGHPRADVVSELFKYLRYRYELSERALVHHAKLAADAMVGKALEMWADLLWADAAATRFPKVIKAADRDLEIDEIKAKVRQSHSAELAAIDEQVRDALELSFRTRGDDGLLEHLAVDLPSANGRRGAAVSALASALLNRKLFQLVGRCSSLAMAAQIYDKHGSRDSRRTLEQEVARFAGLEHRWQVVLWIPSPDMRLKAASVFVDDGTQVAPLDQVDKSGANRGREIYASHEALWALSVFVHRSVTDEQQAVILAWLAERLNIRWEGVPREKPRVVDLAIRQVLKELSLPRRYEDELMAGAADIAARGGEDTYEGVMSRMKDVGRHFTRAPEDDDASDGSLGAEPRLM